MGLIEVEMKNGLKCDTYIALPKEKKDKPLKKVILCMDAFGLRDQLYSMAQQTAEQGYIVAVPNFYYRLGKNLITDLEKLQSKDTIGDVLCQMRGVMAKINRIETVSDVGELIEFLNNYKTDDSNPNEIDQSNKNVGITGYCFGGGVALRSATVYPEIKAAASFHAGRLAIQEDPTSLIHTVDQMKGAELYIGHADNDQSMPADQIKLFEEALAKVPNLKYTSTLYNGCAHGWTMKDTMMWNEQGSIKHFEQLFALLSRNL